MDIFYDFYDFFHLFIITFKSQQKTLLLHEHDRDCYFNALLYLLKK